MPLPPDFAAESLYTEDRWYIHDLLELDAEAGRVVGVLDTTRLEAETVHQRPWPGHHKHVPGAVQLQITATLGNLHAVYVLGLRPSEGWIGYGTHITDARFAGMGRIGPPVVCTLTAGRVRTVRGTKFVSYAFRYEQEGQPIYLSNQIAAWTRAAG
jgi:hypothetical protein